MKDVVSEIKRIYPKLLKRVSTPSLKSMWVSKVRELYKTATEGKDEMEKAYAQTQLIELTRRFGLL